MRSNEKYDVFISYRREDGAIFAESIAHSLKEQGFRVFFDKKDLRVGNDFPYELEKAIQESKEFIAIVSKSYFGIGKNGIRINNKNDWIHKEVLIAMNNPNIHFLPILIGTKAPTLEKIPKDIEGVCSKNFYIFNNQYDTVEKIVDILHGEFYPETIEHAITGKMIREMQSVDVHNNKEFNVLCKKIINHIVSDKEINALNHILNRESNDLYYYDRDYRFVAFYALFSYYRRMHYVHKLIELMEHYSEEFFDYDFFYYSMTEYYTLKFQLSVKKENELTFLEKMIEFAQMAVDRIGENNGIIHSYCLSVAIASENGLNIEKDTITEAIKMINRIIEADTGYARYYSTKARLLTCISNFEDALTNIRFAQTLERPDYNDWMVRISEYYKEECIIRIKQLIEAVDQI